MHSSEEEKPHLKRNLIMKHLTSGLLLFLCVIFISCENSGEEQTSELEATEILLNELGEQEYRNDGIESSSSSKTGNTRNPQSLSIIYRNHSWALENEDGTYNDAKSGALVRLSYLIDGKGLTFNNPTLGSLELTEGKPGFGRFGHKGRKGKSLKKKFGPIYSWSQRDLQTLPSELIAGAKPEFSATQDSQVLSYTFTELPDLSTEITNITEGTVLDVNAGITIEFAKELSAGSVIGVQLLPFKFKPKKKGKMEKGDKKAFGKKARGLIKKLNVKVELSESSSSVTISPEQLSDAVETLKAALGDDLSQVSADIFATTHQENGTLSFKLNGEDALLPINVRSSSSVHVGVSF